MDAIAVSVSGRTDAKPDMLDTLVRALPPLRPPSATVPLIELVDATFPLAHTMYTTTTNTTIQSIHIHFVTVTVLSHSLHENTHTHTHLCVMRLVH